MNTTLTPLPAPEFQSLIGRLQTPGAGHVAGMAAGEFQSLIGRLQTEMMRVDVDDREVVSIPHR